MIGGGRLAAVVTIALSAAYIVLLTSAMTLIRAGLMSTPFGQGETADIVFGVLGGSFLVVSLVVATVVVTNAFALITATRIREIALRRLLGASARAERMRLVREGAGIAAVSLLAGIVLGALGMLPLTAAASGPDGLSPDIAIGDVVDLRAIVPLLALHACSVIAAWRGSAAVLGAEPATALGHAVAIESGGSNEIAIGRTAGAVLVTGLVLLAVAAAAGAITPLGAFIGIAGGTALAIGVLMGARGIMPRILGLVARALPRRGPIAVARATLVEHPARTTRASLGVLIGVSIVTMFAVATESANASMRLEYRGTLLADEADGALDAVLALVGSLVGVIVLVAAIGLATTVALSTRLRAREIAARRVLGQSRRHAGATVVIEAAILSAAATLGGLALGTVLGWVGAQSVLGSTLSWFVVIPVVPVTLVVVLLVGAAIITIASAIAPARFVLADSPVRAFARA